ncbi:hypothetical protein VTL71DRAFT_6435 [Oculimacula yallundae]|uniref:Uncharacterized protein n=1 Tax=Oculimacula yallundae TaxID=86028 RepID=A0ABR4BWY1_9HELO
MDCLDEQSASHQGRRDPFETLQPSLVCIHLHPHLHLYLYFCRQHRQHRQHITSQYSALLHSTPLHSTPLNYDCTLTNAIPFNRILYRIHFPLYCTTLYYTTRHWTGLHCTALH